MMTAAKTGVTTFATPTDLDIVVRRVVDAPRRIAFDAWTNPKHIPKWMLGPPGWSMPVCEVDLRPGGNYYVVWRKSDGTEMGMHGVYREVVPPERVVATESWGPEWPETVNTVLFTEALGQTTITMTVSYPSKEARDTAAATGMKEGMNMSFGRFDELLGTLK